MSPRAHYRGLTAFQKRSREPRFADAGLAREEHHPAFAVLCFAQRRSSSSDSSSRPTRAVRPLACSASKRLSTELARSAAQARTDPAMPLHPPTPIDSSTSTANCSTFLTTQTSPWFSVYRTNKRAGSGYWAPKERVIEFRWSEDVRGEGRSFGSIAGKLLPLLCGGTLVFDASGNFLHMALVLPTQERRRALLDYARYL